MKTSVAMCTYNGERFLESQLASIASQTTPPDEIVVCDDASTDNSFSIVERFALASRLTVRPVRNSRRLGPAKNFEQAITLCSGDLIYLSDQDDRWVPDKTDRIRNTFTRDPELAALFTDARRVTAAGDPLPGTLWKHINFTPALQQRVHRGMAFDVLAADNYATGATMAFRSAWRDAILPIPESGIVHDDWIALILSALARVDCDPAPLIDYRQHPAQSIGSGESAAGVSRWIGAARQTGSADYARRAERLDLVRQRLVTLSANRDVIAGLEERVDHLRARASLPARRLARIPVVSRELRRYFRYSNSVWSVAKDLLW